MSGYFDSERKRIIAMSNSRLNAVHSDAVTVCMECGMSLENFQKLEASILGGNGQNVNLTHADVPDAIADGDPWELLQSIK